MKNRRNSNQRPSNQQQLRMVRRPPNPNHNLPKLINNSLQLSNSNSNQRSRETRKSESNNGLKKKKNRRSAKRSLNASSKSKLQQLSWRRNSPRRKKRHLRLSKRLNSQSLSWSLRRMKRCHISHLVPARPTPWLTWIALCPAPGHLSWQTWAARSARPSTGSELTVATVFRSRRGAPAPDRTVSASKSIHSCLRSLIASSPPGIRAAQTARAALRSGPRPWARPDSRPSSPGMSAPSQPQPSSTSDRSSLTMKAIQFCWRMLSRKQISSPSINRSQRICSWEPTTSMS